MKHLSVASIYIVHQYMSGNVLTDAWNSRSSFFESFSPTPVVKYTLKRRHCQYKNLLSSGKCCAIHSNLWWRLIGFQYYGQDSLEDTSILPLKSQKHVLLLPLLKIRTYWIFSVLGINSNYLEMVSQAKYFCRICSVSD